MPQLDMPWIRGDETLYLPDRHPIPIGSPAWFCWLAQIDAFCYQPPHASDRLTVRKEKRRHQFYWYAYMKNARKLHNAYVGKTEAVTVDRLHQVFEVIMVKVRLRRQRLRDG
jgi:hypothetical protein